MDTILRSGEDARIRVAHVVATRWALCLASWASRWRSTCAKAKCLSLTLILSERMRRILPPHASLGKQGWRPFGARPGQAGGTRADPLVPTPGHVGGERTAAALHGG